MKSTKIYYISDVENDLPEKSTDIINDFTEKLRLLLDKENDDVNFYVDFSSGGILTYLCDYRVENILNLMHEYDDCAYKVDISEEIINGKAYGKYDNTNNYTEMFDRFRIENQTIDDTLDKINKFGKNSLDDIDKSILTK